MVFSPVLEFPRYILVLLIAFFYFLYVGFFPTTDIRAFWFDSGGGGSAVKFRLENVCNQGYTRSAWRGSGKNIQHQSGEAVVIILRLRLKQQLCYEDAEALVGVGNRWSFESWTLEAPITCVQRIDTFGL